MLLASGLTARTFASTAVGVQSLLGAVVARAGQLFGARLQ